jgi:tRNA modification GTPase
MHLRVAEPGEFTQRAFLNGKLDLAQAEAIADLIDASTEAAARSATRSLAGEFSREIHALRDALVNLRMLVEATLDFPEEEIDFLQKADAPASSNGCRRLGRVMQRAHQGALLREGLHVVIAGQPNAGKSSLLNALAGAELAIVTPIPGTTRDVVRQTIQIEGVPLHVVDTAGLREGADQVEQIGIERAWGQIEKADAVVFLHDLTRAEDPRSTAARMRRSREAAGGRAGHRRVEQGRCATIAAPPGHPRGAGDPKRPCAHMPSPPNRQGLEDLRQQPPRNRRLPAAPEGVFIARERHLHALRRVDAHLMEAAALLARQAQALDLLAEELRLAQNALNEITGEFSADDLLGVIFSRFCIGK